MPPKPPLDRLKAAHASLQLLPHTLPPFSMLIYLHLRNNLELDLEDTIATFLKTYGTHLWPASSGNARGHLSTPLLKRKTKSGGEKALTIGRDCKMSCCSRDNFLKRNGELPSPEYDKARSKLGIGVGRAMKAFDDLYCEVKLKQAVGDVGRYEGVSDRVLLTAILGREVDDVSEEVCLPQAKLEEEELEDKYGASESRDEALVFAVEAWMAGMQNSA